MRICFDDIASKTVKLSASQWKKEGERQKKEMKERKKWKQNARKPSGSALFEHECAILWKYGLLHLKNARTAFESFECTFPDIFEWRNFKINSTGCMKSKQKNTAEFTLKICYFKHSEEFGRIFAIAVKIPRSECSKINFNAKLIWFSYKKQQQTNFNELKKLSGRTMQNRMQKIMMMMMNMLLKMYSI